MSEKLNLNDISTLWKFSIIGEDIHGGIDLGFENVIIAASFVSATGVADTAKFTFPALVPGFNSELSVTIPRYRDTFEAI